MTITLELQPDVEKGLLAQSHSPGVSLTELAQEVLAREAHVSDVVTTLAAPAGEAKNLYELFAPVRGLLTEEEAETLFNRNPSAARPVDFE